MMAEAGKRFYSWQTLSTLGGSVGAVTMIWAVLRNVGGQDFAANWVALVLSVVIVAAIALLTEPPEQTTWRDKGQKAFQAVFNSILVYATVVGIPHASILSAPA